MDIGNDHIIRRAFALELAAMRGMLQVPARPLTDLEFDAEAERMGNAQ